MLVPIFVGVLRHARFPTNPYLYDDIDPNISPEANHAILGLILAWPRLEHALTDWLVAACRLEPDVGAILIGNMDTRSKIDKIMSVAGHLKQADDKKILKPIRKTHHDAVECRNTVVHSIFHGMWKSRKRPTLLFGTGRYIIGVRNTLRAVPVSIDEIDTTKNLAIIVTAEVQRQLDSPS